MSAIFGTKRAAVFGPAEIDKLATAYHHALSEVTEDTDLRSALTAREIRHQVAASIIAKAATGVIEPERLKEAALQSLQRPFAEAPE